MINLKSFLTISFVFLAFGALCQQVWELRRFQHENSRQAVAVTDEYILVIDNSAIAKLDKRDLTEVAIWRDTTGTIPHLNSGFVWRDTLYCATSNYPQVPMTSSIEVFSIDSLRHVGTHSFGIFKGSCTWIVRQGQHWYAFFAHYENRAQSEGRGVEWSTLVRFDDLWVEQSTWTIPMALVGQLRPYSLSGGLFLDETHLICTGHHDPIAFLLRIPESGSDLILEKEIKVPIKGQGIAYDDYRNSYWGIDRSKKEVIEFRIEN
ncbi:MAG: hypothetical protein KI790_11665 [Cyclobacteriaceae bacterium]|nr:hypothetical protein [Cyclobacteriaceae bacterium HetDA_MAG_MS6]